MLACDTRHRGWCGASLELPLSSASPTGTRQSLLCRGPFFTLGKGSVPITWCRHDHFSLSYAIWRSANTLTSAQHKVLDKEDIDNIQFIESSLTSATLVKAFAECYRAFAECLWHSAKNSVPVVYFSKNFISQQNILLHILIDEVSEPFKYPAHIIRACLVAKFFLVPMQYHDIWQYFGIIYRMVFGKGSKTLY